MTKNKILVNKLKQKLDEIAKRVHKFENEANTVVHNVVEGIRELGSKCS